jgi:hypothetical protein
MLLTQVANMPLGRLGTLPIGATIQKRYSG